MIATDLADVLNRVADVCPRVDVPDIDRPRVLAAIYRLELELGDLAARLGPPDKVNGTPVNLPPTTPVKPDPKPQDPPPAEPKDMGGRS